MPRDSISPSPDHAVSDGVETLARRYARGSRLGLHTHGQAQLLFASNGLMQVTTPKGRWLVPPQRGIWLPPWIEHEIDMLTDIDMRTLYLRADRVSLHPDGSRLDREFVVFVSALLRDLILALFDGRAHRLRADLLAQLALFELAEAEDATTFIPMPADARARRLAELALADIKGLRSLERLAQEAGVSQRTAARLFPAQTHMTFKKWRQRARMMAAIEVLGSEQLPIKQVSARLGYASVAAFTAAFREIVGSTPGQFLDRVSDSAAADVRI
jgi:AraC-like DNA-binding protein